MSNTQKEVSTNDTLNKELRKYIKKNRGIQKLKIKPYDQLNQDQKNKLATEEDVKDHIRYLETVIKEQNAPKTVKQPVTKKAKQQTKRNKGKKTSNTNNTKQMAELNRKAYEKHKLRSKIERLKEKHEQRSRKKLVQQLRQKRQTRDVDHRNNVGWMRTLIHMMETQHNVESQTA